MQPSVNLFQTKAEFSPVLRFIDRYVRIGAIVLSAIALVGATIVIAMSFIFSRQLEALEKEKQTHLTAIKSAVATEQVVIDMGKRLSLISTILKTQENPAPFIDSVTGIIDPNDLQQFSISGKNTINLSLAFTTLDQAASTVENIIRMTSTGAIKSPMMDTFSITEKGIILMTVSYQVVKKS